VKVALGSDHGGYALKEQIKTWLGANGHEVEDLGCDSTEPVDYPVYAIAVARRVTAGEADRGILVCGTGVGMAMAANKIAGIRAAVVNDLYCAEHARAHNDANIMAIGGRVVDEETARRIVAAFLNTKFEGGRHARRVDQIMALENDWGK
jgi:ribose 5-phosphate isomerase B